MLTKQLFNTIAAAIETHGYSVDNFKPTCTDVMDIWHKDRSLGYIEITFCEAREGYAIICPVDYDRPEDGLIEIFNTNVGPLIDQLNAFYNRS